MNAGEERHQLMSTWLTWMVTNLGSVLYLPGNPTGSERAFLRFCIAASPVHYFQYMYCARVLLCG